MSSRLLLLALLLLLGVAIVARAQEDAAGAGGEGFPAEAEEDADFGSAADDEERDPNVIQGVRAIALFDPIDSATGAPRVPAGSKLWTRLVFGNDLKNPTFEVGFIVAHLTRLNDHNNYIQNYSATKHARAIARGETATFRYLIEPSEMLEPNDYTLVVRVFFRGENNQTFATVAYNGTVTIDDPLGTDPKSIMAVLTALGAVAAAGYFAYNRFVAGASSRGRRGASGAATSASPSKAVEAGTTGGAIDPQYISKEHLAYREALLRRGPSSSPKRK